MAALVASSILGAPRVSQAAASDANPLQLRRYTQELEIEFASAADAANAQLVPCPVYDGKTWAFSARWDDNHPNNFVMLEHMAKFGLRGTFYLNASRKTFGEAEARKLTANGCSVGGHTMTHPLLTGLIPNEMFYEVLANRIEREAQVDTPINSLAFPSGRYETPADPDVIKTVSQVFVRSGYFNTPYLSFARKNAALQPFEVSTGLQVVPGDHAVNVAAFDQNIGKILLNAASYRKESYLIHMGVHARQTGAAWEDIDRIFAKYAHNPDWWYCSMTEYAAYDRQFRNTTIEPIGEPAGASRKYRITRPTAGELGHNVPLTLQLSNASMKGVHATGFECRSVPERGILNLSHSVQQVAPQRIDVIDNEANSPEPIDGHLADFPDIDAWLYCDTATKTLRLQLQNRGQAPLADVRITLRLPPAYIGGIRRLASIDLGSGERKSITEPLGGDRPEATYHDGRAYLAAEIDFRRGTDAGRIFATTRLPESSMARNCLRDAARMMGPFAPTDVKIEDLAPASVVGASLPDLRATPDRTWFSSSVAQRRTYSSERATLYRDTREWKTAAGQFDGKLQCYLVAVDFALSEASNLRLTTEAKPLGILLNGKPIALSKTIDGGVKGANRMIMMFSISDGRAVWCVFPMLFRLEPLNGSLQYSTVPAQP